MGGSTDLANEFLGAIVADRAGEAVHAGLSVELVAQVLHIEVAALLSSEQPETCRIKLIERLTQLLFVIQRHDPAALEIHLAFRKAILAIMSVGREVACGGGSFVMIEAAECGFGCQFRILPMAQRVGVAIEVAMNFQLANAMNAGTNEVSKLTGDRHFL